MEGHNKVYIVPQLNSSPSMKFMRRLINCEDHLGNKLKNVFDAVNAHGGIADRREKERDAAIVIGEILFNQKDKDAVRVGDFEITTTPTISVINIKTKERLDTERTRAEVIAVFESSLKAAANSKNQRPEQEIIDLHLKSKHPESVPDRTNLSEEKVSSTILHEKWIESYGRIQRRYHTDKINARASQSNHSNVANNKPSTNHNGPVNNDPPTANLHDYDFDKYYEVNEHHLQAVKSDRFQTHTDPWKQDIHKTAEAVLAPTKFMAQGFASTFNPAAGENKDSYLTPLKAIGEGLLTAGATLTGFMAAPLGASLRASVHRDRPLVSYMENIPLDSTEPAENVLTKERPLKIRTLNCGFTPSTLNIAADLTTVESRAKQMVKYINEDPEQPDIICFQETFHEDGAKILMDGLKESYPYIVHSVLPTSFGLSAGNAFASKYPIKSVEFKRFKLMAGFQALTPRGTCKVEIRIPGHDPLFVYSAHTQALVGEDFSLARFTQIHDIDDFMKKNREKDNGEQHQVLLGDFNTSRLTAWGEDNVGTGQAEEEVLKLMAKKFDDLFLVEHEATGERKEGTKPHYLGTDNIKMGNIDRPEPKGSWSRGPFQDSKLVDADMRLNRWKHGRPQLERPELEPSPWGTKEWYAEQPADTARFDYILFPKESKKRIWINQLEGTAEIRRMHTDETAQSAISDHLPVDARIWLKNEQQNTASKEI